MQNGDSGISDVCRAVIVISAAVGQRPGESDGESCIDIGFVPIGMVSNARVLNIFLTFTCACFFFFFLYRKVCRGWNKVGAVLLMDLQLTDIMRAVGSDVGSLWCHSDRRFADRWRYEALSLESTQR